MRIESAIERDNFLEIIIDGRKLYAGEKYTILETGFAVYLLFEEDDDWVKKNGDTLPADPEDNRQELRSGGGMLVTADPVLVALALEDWWSRNGDPIAYNVALPNPTAFEAVEIVRNRRILSDFNLKWKGVVPGLAIMEKRVRIGKAQDYSKCKATNR